MTQKLPNMFTILDDESKSPRTTDATLVLNWRNNVKDHPNFRAMNGDELAFVITHFADEVKHYNPLPSTAKYAAKHVVSEIESPDRAMLEKLIYKHLDRL